MRSKCAESTRALTLAALFGVTLATVSCSASAPRASELPSQARSAAAPSLLLIDVDGTTMKLRMRPVDPVTLADVPGARPISLGHNYTSAVSPDGRWLAAITWPGGTTGNRGGVLHVIDLHGWTDRQTTVTFDDHVRQLVFGSDSRHVYWVRPGPMTGEPAMNPDPGLYRYDLTADKVTRVVALPAMFLPEFSGLGIVGNRMAIIGSTVGNPAPSRLVSVYLIDLAKDTLVTTMQPAGIRAGQVTDASAADSIRNVRPGIGWDRPHGLVYLVDADDDRVVAIDLASGAMRGPVLVRPRAALLERLLGLISSIAAAKAQSSSERSAVVSPDGRRLYISGIRSEFNAGTSREQVTPLPLQVIDTADLTEIGRMDLASTELSISSDGSRLLLVTNRFESRLDGFATRTGYELRLIDTARLAQVAALPLEGRGRILAFDPGGDAVYVGAYAGFESTTLRRVSLANLDTQVSRNLEHNVGELVAPSGAR